MTSPALQSRRDRQAALDDRLRQQQEAIAAQHKLANALRREAAAVDAAREALLSETGGKKVVSLHKRFRAALQQYLDRKAELQAAADHLHEIAPGLQAAQAEFTKYAPR